MTRRSQAGLDVELEWAGDSTGKRPFRMDTYRCCRQKLASGTSMDSGKVAARRIDAERGGEHNVRTR